jgi:TolB-like protein
VPLSLDGTMAPLGFRQFQLLDIAGWSGEQRAPEAQRILAAVRSRSGEAAPAAAAPVTPAPAPTTHGAPGGGAALSRRAVMIGGAAIAGAGALVTGWATGLFAPRAAGAVSMVVLPFANLTGDEAKAWFSNGLSNELRSVLVRNPRLKVAAPTSSSLIAGEDQFAIGRKLGVEHILRGSVQRDETRMRVSAKLVEISGGLVRWAESYDRGVEDVFALQSEIAETVALSLVAEVASEQEAQTSIAAQQEVGGTANIAAYEAFLRGKALADLSAGVESNRSALAQFDAAIAADPDYAAAHAMRASMLSGIANTASDAAEVATLFKGAIAAATRAITLEDRLAKGHLALGFALNNGQLNRAAALPHYRAAETLARGEADAMRDVAMFYAYGAEQDTAMRMIEQVIALDPLNARVFRTAGYISLLAHDYAAVIDRMERALALNPSLARAHFAVANARLMQGDAAAALAAAKAEPVAVFSLTATAIAAHKLGDGQAADAALARLLADHGSASRYQEAQVWAQRGDAAKALAALEQAWMARDPGLLFARNDPLLDPLRQAPQFADLLSRLSS